jgi:hypothetical protein
MTDQNPITPPPELVQQWASESLATQHLCTQAARWGADQELEACVKWMNDNVPYGYGHRGEVLRISRRPKPPSLKEQALASVKRFEENGEFFSDQMRELEFIRKALEQLDD